MGFLLCRKMGEGAVVPESVLKKQKRSEEWALAKKQEVEATKKKNAENRKLIFNRAKLYAKEYDEQVCNVARFCVCCLEWSRMNI